LIKKIKAGIVLCVCQFCKILVLKYKVAILMEII